MISVLREVEPPPGIRYVRVFPTIKLWWDIFAMPYGFIAVENACMGTWESLDSSAL
jgi:hypothetical protein